MKRKKKSQSHPLDVIRPEQQLDQFKPYLSDQEYALLFQEISKPLLPALRVNPLKTGADFVSSLSKRYGWQMIPVPFCSSGFHVQTNSDESISASLEHKNGLFYIQEAASMLPVELFDQNSAEDLLTLDLAASPGGKTTHLISRQNDTGLVIANDSSQSRIQALRIVLKQWGSVSSAVTRFPGEKYGAWFPNTFDRVLIDAPCSMQGLRTAESHSSRPVTEKESKLLSQRQIALLTSALQAARHGGEVVYSTCTLLPAEDEGVVESILKRFSGSITLLDANSHLPYPAPGIEDGYSNSMTKTIRLWPHRYQTAGFFACVFQKTDDLDLPALASPEHSMENAGFIELPNKSIKSFSDTFEDLFGYPLYSVLETQKLTIIQRDQKYYLFPRLLLERFRGLPVQSAGILLCEAEPDGLIPSQEWSMRFGKECRNILVNLDHSQSQVFLDGEDLINYSDSIKTNTSIRILADESGRILGRGKKIQSRLKNLSFKQLAG